MHYRWSPTCRPVAAEASSGGRDRATSFNLFATRFQSFVTAEVWDAHTSHFVPVAHTEVSRTMIISVVLFVVTFITVELRAEAETPEGITLEAVLALCEKITNFIRLLPTARRMVDTQKQQYLQVEPRLRGDGKEEKLAVTFSIIQLIIVMLTESKAVRHHCITSSKLWKTGELYKKVPKVYTDVTSARRFRSSDACKLATPDQAKDLRIQLHMWNDAFTSTDGMGAKAKENKWEVVLVALLNLPLHMRHYFDHILLVALCQYQWATRNGGVARILCGVDDSGTELKAKSDVLNLRSEVRATQEGKVKILLPDDENPSNTDGIEFVLRLGISLISLDWLANGAFGPFAEAVSANRPCFKCLWTDKCGCAWIARSDKRNESIVHHALCRQRRLRTHDETMQVVREMRAMAPTQLKTAQTEHGIFSTVFASEYLLNDIVKDATIDIMHIFLSSGMIPYHLSWLLDICIPDEFSTDAMNAKIKEYNRSRKGHHIPSIHQSAKADRLSAKISITAGEGLSLALASPQIFDASLVKDPNNPHWISWFKLVAVVRFVTRRQFSMPEDVAQVQQLYDDWMRSIEHVPQWKGCWKPKHHLGDHLGDALDEHGPWRAYWCMWGEGFLQYLKCIFDMSNYKSAAHTVGTVWAAKACERYRDPARVVWHADAVEPAEDDAFKQVEHLIPPISAPMANGLAAEDALAARHLASLMRDGIRVAVADWVLITYCGVTVVGQVSSMLQVQLQKDEHVVSLVRMLINHVCNASFDVHDSVTVALKGSGNCMYVPLECAHVSFMTHEHDVQRKVVTLRAV